ncbi:redox-regulated ATPase YchF [Candidatus Bathyarchaeota archaeon]|nr:redox-regulated ATPase YchF [Candidatus Bathyarchaeota archaeon]
MGYLVGVVGKPNVGKSTFFSAATMATVPIAAYPFTTIKPNRGVGYVRVQCVCRELGVDDEPVNSVCEDGVRLIPVELVDCAGLVPDAWRGRGLGNKFLDEIMTADALIHVVDASGGTDVEGRVCEPGTHDPVDDIIFLDRELDMWLLGILKRDWEKVVRRSSLAREELLDAIADRLSGLAIRRGHIEDGFKQSGLDIDDYKSWCEDDLLRLVHTIRSIAKPMLIAANKIDVQESEENLPRLRALGYEVVPCSAEAELVLRRSEEKMMTDYKPGDGRFRILEPGRLTQEQLAALEKIQKVILDVWGSTGVQESINSAFLRLLGMIVVYPVEDLEKLADHKGRVLPDAYLVPSKTTAREFAAMIHSDLARNFLYATEARSRMRVGDDYIVKDRDVLSITSSAGRA